MNERKYTQTEVEQMIENARQEGRDEERDAVVKWFEKAAKMKGYTSTQHVAIEAAKTFGNIIANGGHRD